MKNLIYSLVAISLVFATSCNDGGADKSKPENDTTTSHKRYTRYNVLSKNPQAAKDMEDMRIAFDSMRKMDCSNPLSWYYQGAMHMVPGMLPVNPYCGSYHKTSDAKAGWDQCTHASRTDPANVKYAATLNFLLWHRLYTWYLEKIVRKLSGDPEFAIPYWGYTDLTDTIANRTMPGLWRDTKSSLYTTARFDSLNKGVPLNGEILEYLKLKSLFQETKFFNFSNSINGAPHGMMHDYIGGGNYNVTMWNPIFQDSIHGGLMAEVPSAGMDPIFWLHHSNIDRIWQQWTNSPKGVKATLAEVSANPWWYLFFNEKGDSVRYTIDQVMKIIYNVDYDYDDTPCPSTKEEKQMLAAAPQRIDTLINKKIAKMLSKKAEVITVEEAPAKTKMLKAAAPKWKKAYVTITVSFKKEPRGGYKVFINLPAGTVPSVESNYFAGYMNFFGAGHSMAGMGGGMEMEGTSTKEFVYDLSDEFLATNAVDKNKFDVTIISSNPKSAPITVENVMVTLE